MTRASPVLLLSILLATAASADDLRVLPDKVDGVAPQEMMHVYLMRRVGEALDRRDAQYEALKTPEQLAAYQERMRKFFVDQLGGFPEPTPLEPQVVGALQRDGYRVEKVIYQSRPRHYVTAALYLPDSPPPYPGVLVPCGHSANGKAMEAYQRACILLAKNGLAALCYDPIDQGERFQLLDDKGKPRIGGTSGHSQVGLGAILLGHNAATFRVWDGIRSIDYLVSRPEIDRQRIGCTGNSGGGTLTSYLMALEPRIRAAAPSCYLTTLRRLLETIGPQDGEQNIHAQVACGMDHADYVLMRAPQPTLMCTATRDFFDIGGAWQTFRQAKRFYGRLGFPERVDLVETDQEHGFSPLLRTSAVRWMRRWLLGADDAIIETESPVLTDQEMQCTPQGQAMLLEGARSAYDINAEEDDRLAPQRKKLWAAPDKTAALAEVRRITGIRKLDAIPAAASEKVGTLQREGYRIDKLILKPEPGIWLAALAFLPERPGGDAYLYLSAAGKEADAAAGGPIESLVKQGSVVLAVDLRGLGETQGPTDRKFASNLGPEFTDATLAYMLDTSYLAMRAEDVLVAARFLAGYEAGDRPRKVHLVSIGPVGPPALHAAALEPQLFASVTLRNSLASWSSVVHTPLASQQYVNVVHGALRAYDLPDLVASLPADRITLAAPLDAMGQPISPP